MPLTVHQKWTRLKRWLRTEYPLRHPVRVYLRPIKDQGGTEFGGEERFVITVRQKQSWPLQADAIIHEWAHALTWFGLDEDVHGEEWGLAYARLYRTLLVWNYGQKENHKQTSQ